MARKYFISFIEEAVVNPAHAGYIGGRIEVYSDDPKDEYASGEIRFFTKDVDAFYAFRDKYDFEDVDEKTLNLIREIITEKFYGGE